MIGPTCDCMPRAAAVVRKTEHWDKFSLWASLVAQLVKNLPVMQEMPVQFLGKGLATHSSIPGLPWWLR